MAGRGNHITKRKIKTNYQLKNKLQWKEKFQTKMKTQIAIRGPLGVVLLPKKLNNTQKIFVINGCRSGKNIVIYVKDVTVRIMIPAYIVDVSSKISEGKDLETKILT